MSKLLFRVIALSAVLCILALSQSSQAALTDGLISYWPLDEGSGITAGDAVGSNDGTLNASQGAGVIPVWVAGKIGGALYFDGISSNVDCGSDVSLKPASAVTLSAWIKTDATSYYGQIAGYATDTGDSESGYSIITEEGDWIGAWLTGSSGDGWYFWTDDVPAYPNVDWVHVALTYDGAASILYVNADAKASDTHSGNIDYDHVLNFLIGSYDDPIGSYWFPYEGLIDEVAVWGRALLPAEITALYNGGAGKRLIDYPPEAWEPNPNDGEKDVPLDKTLSWNTGPDPNSGLTNTAITAHVLYMNNGSATNADLYQVGPPIAASGATGQYAGTGDWLDRDGKYLWRIDEVEPNPPEPDIIHTGAVWAFETVTSAPSIDAATPADALVDAGEDVVFTVSATNPFTGDSTGMTYQWYKDGSPIGTNSTTLEINNAQLADGGGYYCTVTIISNSFTTDSRTASLVIKRLIGHWKMDETNGTIASDSAETGDGTLVGSQFRFDNKFDGQIGPALNLDGFDNYVSLPAVNLNFNTMTITAWVKADTAANDWDGIVFNRGTGIANGISLNGTELRYHWNDANYDWLSGLYVTVGEWTFVAMAVESDKATLAVNGAFATNTVAHAPEAFDVAGETQIGHDNSGDGTTRFFDGGIDDVRIYNYALDPYAIAQLYVDGKPGAEVCVEYPVYDFDQDCIVGLGDLAELAIQWLSCNVVPDCL